MNQYKIDDVQKRTNLNKNFIRRCVKSLSSELKPHISKGDKNALIFSSNALTIFDRIAELKNQGASLNSIKEKLDLNPVKQVSNSENQNYQTLNNENQTDLLNKFIAQFDEVKKLMKENANLQNEVTEKNQIVDTLKSHLNLLTEGKTPEEKSKEMIKSSYELEQKKLLVNALNEGIHALQELEEKREDKELLLNSLLDVEKKNSFLGIGKRKKRVVLLDKIEAINQETLELNVGFLNLNRANYHHNFPIQNEVEIRNLLQLQYDLDKRSLKFLCVYPPSSVGFSLF